jgi:hypothetical protein
MAISCQVSAISQKSKQLMADGCERTRGHVPRCHKEPIRAGFTIIERNFENRSKESAGADSGVHRSGIFNEVEDSREVDGARASEQRP